MARPSTGHVVEREVVKGGRMYAVRFSAYGKRRYVTLGTVGEGWNRSKAETELTNILADVRRGIWTPPEPPPVIEERDEPNFHAFASEYVAARRPELRPRSIEALEWALSVHLLPAFRDYRLSAITAEAIDRYRVAKVNERESIEKRRAEALARDERFSLRGLSNGSINKTIAVLARVLDQAVEYGWVESNPARGKRRRLKADKPRRTWLELDEVRAILDAAEEHRPLLATMVLAGLRVSEACGLRWRDVDLARGRLNVAESKTDAGVRVVELTPDLLDELKAHKAGADAADGSDVVFPNRRGTARERNNVRTRVLGSTIVRANARLAKAGKAPIQAGVTNHTLRRTFASLLYEAGASPAYVMAQLGHTSSALALEVYARKMERTRDTGTRMDALLRGADWAPIGTTGADEALDVALVGNDARGNRAF